jgi:hypothetical protein
VVEERSDDTTGTRHPIPRILEGCQQRHLAMPVIVWADRLGLKLEVVGIASAVEVACWRIAWRRILVTVLIWWWSGRCVHVVGPLGWVGFSVNFLHLLEAGPGVDLSYGEVRVAEDRLQISNSCPILEHRGGHRMSKQVT